MPAVYQPRRGRPSLPVVLLALLAAGACGDAPPVPPSAPELTPRRDALAAFFASAAFEPARGARGERLAATRRSARGPRAVWLGPAAGEVAEILSGERGASRALVQLDAARALVEVEPAVPGTAADWVVAGPGAARRRAGPPAGESWRFLAAAPAGAGAYVAASALAGGAERLLQLSATGEPRALADAPPGLAFAAVASDGLRAALVRRRDEGADELYLLDRTHGETTLLLPNGEDGRFRPVAFSRDGGALLLLSNDRTDLPHADWLDLRTRERSAALESPCAVTDARPAEAGGPIAFELACGGRTEVTLRTAGDGTPLPAPPLPSGVRAVAAWPATAEAPLLYAAAGPRWPRDLWRLAAADEAAPLTYGLAASVDPADLVESEPIVLATPDGDLPAELWRPRRAGPGGVRPGLIWLEDDGAAMRWFELEPLCQYLAQRGFAVVRLRPRGSEGLGRRLRAAGVGRRDETGSGDVELARRALVERAGAEPSRLALLGEGAWNGALAAALATRGEPPFATVIAVDPAPDPLAPPEPAVDGAPASPDPALARRREALRLGSAPARRDLRVVFDPASARGAAAGAALAAAPDGGGRVLRFELATPPLGAPRIDLHLAELLVEQLRPLLAPPPPPGGGS